MSDPVVVYGTGGMGREALAWTRAAHPGRDIAGFLDDDASRHGTQVAGLRVLGGRDWLTANAADVVLAVGNGKDRARIDEGVRATGCDVLTVVHPSAIVGPRSTVGTGSILAPGVIITTDVVIGNTCILNYGCAVGHDGRLGKHVFVGPGAVLAGRVAVDDRAEIGIGANVRQGTSIGADAVVGGGAMVLKDVPAGVIVVGVPAKPVE